MHLVLKKYNNWQNQINNHKKDLFLSTIFLFFSLICYLVSSRYVDRIDTVSVPDLILDILPVIDLSFIFIWGYFLVVVIFIGYPLIFKPKKYIML